MYCSVPERSPKMIQADALSRMAIAIMVDSNNLGGFRKAGVVHL